MVEALTAKEIGQRIQDALEETGVRREKVCANADISLSTLVRYMNGTDDASALVVWHVAYLTKKPFGWFAGERDEPAEARLATTAERAEATVRAMQSALSQLLIDLTDARSRILDNVEGTRERTVGKQGSKQGNKSVTIPRKAAG
jgi:transcriptional regulator with XRE-family HTH domain